MGLSIFTVVCRIFLFLCGPFYKSLLSLLQYCFYVFDSFWLQSMWDLSSPTKDQSGEGGNEFCFHPVVFETSVTVR